MAAATDVMNRIANLVPEIKTINALHMAAATDVLNQIALRVPKERPTNVKPMEVGLDVRIALIGLIVVVVHLLTTVIVQLVSNDAFLRMHAVKLSMLIPKKLW
jgi:hypothetical protein